MADGKILGLPGRDVAAWVRGAWVLGVDDLMAGAERLAAGLPAELGAVVGIPRSGMMVAGLISALRHVPLLAFSGGAPVPLDGGQRTEAGYACGNVLAVIDDTAALGGHMQAAFERARLSWAAGPVVRAAVFVSPEALAKVDFCVAVLGWPHYLLWNLANAFVGSVAGWDLDGVICQRCPAECDDGGPGYAAWLASAEPYLLPVRCPARLIVSARPERFRAATEEWLQRWGVRCEQLILGPWDGPADRPGAVEVGRWKAWKLGVGLVERYIEDDAGVAAGIARYWPGEVVCLGGRAVWNFAWPRSRAEVLAGLRAQGRARRARAV